MKYLRYVSIFLVFFFFFPQSNWRCDSFKQRHLNSKNIRQLICCPDSGPHMSEVCRPSQCDCETEFALECVPSCWRYMCWIHHCSVEGFKAAADRMRNICKTPWSSDSDVAHFCKVGNADKCCLFLINVLFYQIVLFIFLFVLFYCMSCL